MHMIKFPLASYSFRLLGSICISVGTLAVIGCGGVSTSVPVFPCTGQVLIKGKPVEGVQVTLTPASGEGAVASGKTDKDGKFRLNSTVGEGGMAVTGAPAGEYLVGLALAARSDSQDFLGQKIDKSAPVSMDRKYADPKTSGFKATVKGPETTLEPFEIK